MDADRQVNEDLGRDYQAQIAGRQKSTDVAEMEQFVKESQTNGILPPPPVQSSGDPGRPLPVAKPLRLLTPDSIGRQQVDMNNAENRKAVSRNVGEIPGAVVGGVESAIKHGLGWAIDPLANWLNENVADLSYNRAEPHTPTGELTKSISEFLTGFIPFLKGVKAMGVAGNVVPPMMAGALADFSVRDPASGRLADIWKKMNLPPNILTDYLSSKPDDSEMESRFKNAVEGVGLGALTEGVFMAARALRAMKGVGNAAQAEKDYLRNKYGEVTDETLHKVVGDPTKPSVEMVVREPSNVPGKIARGADETANLAPRSVIRSRPKVSTAPRDDEMVMYHGTRTDAPELKASDQRGALYFAENRGVAEDYAHQAEGVAEPHVREMLVSNKNMFDPVSNPEHAALYKKFLDDHPQAHVADDFEVMESKVARDWLKSQGFKSYRILEPEGNPSVGVIDKSVIRPNPIQSPELSIVKTNDGFILRDKHGSNLAGGPTADKDEFRALYNEILDNNGEKMITKQEFEKLLRPKTPTIESQDFEVYINFAKFDEPDQVKFAIGKMAEANKGAIDEATRGVITQKETQKLADDLGMTVTDLIARRKGQGFNAEEAVAARQLWAASGERLVELAKVAASKNAGALDQYAFRKAMATHAAIQAEVIGARTETARALASWKIPVSGNIERARAIDQVINAMGGPEASSEMARRLAILAETNANPAAIARFVEKGWGATTADAVKEAWVNGLLSNPKTHVVNMLSNTLVAAASVVERQAAAGIRGLTGGEGVSGAEAAAMTFGMVSSMRDAWNMAAKALRTGETSWTFNKVDLPKVHSISSEAMGMASDTGWGRFVDFLGNAARVPTRLLGAEDEFFKTIGYRAELHAQAARTALQEGHQGYDLGKRIAEIVQNPPEHIMINSADAALYMTFTNEVGAFGRAVMGLRNIDHALNPMVFILPFVRTPINIARFAFERTPFAPLVSQWRDDVAAGGARADLALARMSTGTAAMLVAMDYADKGYITGAGFRGGKDTSVTEAQERQGWMPYSVQIGNRFYSYNRTDPFGMTMGFAASIAEAVKKGEISEDEIDEWQEVAAMSIAAVSQVVVSKTYLEGFARFVEVMSDPKRYSQKYIDDLVASFLPATSLMAGVKNIVDPVNREVTSPREAVEARIAGLSQNLPPRRDLWGKETSGQSGFGKAYDFLSPVASKPVVDSPIDKEMVRLNHGVERLQKQTTFDGVQANMRFYPKAYDDYVRLAGNDYKSPAHGGLGAKDYLDAVVSGKHPLSAVYNVLSDESRKAFIQSSIQDFRKMAQRQVLQDPQHAAFKTEIDRLKEIHQGARMPVL